MPIANYTTTVPVSRTLGSIMGMLASAGASSITQDIEDGMPTGIEFSIKTEFGVRYYRMPVRVLGVLGALKADPGVSGGKFQSPEHAARVAWRIAHDWLRAQLALIEAGMASLPEVMMPYTLVGGGNRTAFEAYRERELEQ